MEDRAGLAPSAKKQEVVFIRHGIARHNIVDVTTGKAPDLKDPRLFDPPLILEGKRQALDVGEKLRHWRAHRRENLELVVTSPLSRCLQTASLAFLPGDQYDSRPPVFACVELVREAYGRHYPDRRRKKSELKVR